MAELRERALAVLRERFGHAEFQGPQLEIIDHVVSGGDALVIMPTGGGKSLCYQVPALLGEGLTIVLSPLIALMQDQVDQLARRGIPATFINSSLDRRERESRLRAVVAGESRILYVTPERFRKPEFAAAIDRLEIDLLAVDEAHCISAWGHDFRPEYGRVGRIRERLGAPPTLALTATATPETQRDIRARLGIEGARLFHTGIGRPNLHVSVHEIVSEELKFERLVELIRAVDGPAIVYTALIKYLRGLQDRLRREGIETLVYHGELTANERRRAQRRFLDSDDAVILATNAFGMGVDKPDIRLIVHTQIPGSVEAYYQEIGRAGRDGESSLCELLYFQEDLMIQKQFAEWANPDAEFLRNVYHTLDRWGDTLHARELQDLREELLLKNRADGRPEMVLGLLRAEGVVDGSFEHKDLRIVRALEPGEERRLIHDDKRERDLRRLLEVVQYAGANRCRKRELDVYFGFADGPERCGSCDRCEDLDARLDAFPHRDLARRRGGGGDRHGGSGGGGDELAGAPVRPGDWLLVKGRFAVNVQSVEPGQDGGWRVQAQSADDFRVRSYDLDRVPWERLER